MTDLIPVESPADIPAPYQGTPIGLLLEYHNLNRPFAVHSQAQLLIGMCMDHRKQLRLPRNFAYVLRTGGANLSFSEFYLSYAIAVGGIQAVAIIGHTHCGMVNLTSRREAFVEGLIRNAGWDREQAEAHFARFAPTCEIGNEVNFALRQVQSLRIIYPCVLFAPLLYKIEDNRLYLIDEPSTQ